LHASFFELFPKVHRHVAWSDVTANCRAWSVVVKGNVREALHSKKRSFFLGEDLGVLDCFVDAEKDGFFAFRCDFATANVVEVLKVADEGTIVVPLEAKVK
jgi:hypothetical protein